MYPREGRTQACSKEGAHWVLCLASIYFLGFWREQVFFLTTNVFSGFSMACACALPLSNLFPGFSRACTLKRFTPSPRISQASPLPFMAVILALLYLYSVKGISPHRFPPSPCLSPGVAVKLSVLPSCLGGLLPGMMGVTSWSDCETAVSQFNQA